MTYQELAQLTEGKTFPLCGKNQDGENVIIRHCTDKWSYKDRHWDNNYFELATAQHNGWTRINWIHEDGHTEEAYQRRN